MPGQRLPMRKIRDVLRLSRRRHVQTPDRGQPIDRRDGGRRLHSAFTAGRLGWPLPEILTMTRWSGSCIRRRRSRRRTGDRCRTGRRSIVSCAGQGVTLQLLWEEHRGIHPDGYGHSRYCELYRAWEGRFRRRCGRPHVAGEKLFVDYAGTTIEVVDGTTGEVHVCQLFVAALGASSFTYAEATFTQRLSDWIGSHVRAFGFSWRRARR